jgi:filamin
MTTEKEQFITEQQNSSKEDDLTTTEKEEFITEQQNSSEEDELNIDNLDEEGEEFIDVSYTVEPQSQYSTTSPEPNSDHNSSSIPSPSLSRSLSPVTLSDPPQIEAPAIAPLPRAFPEKCIAEGNGLKWGIVNKTTSFTVDCSNAGRGRLEVVIETPDGDNLEAEGQQLRSNVFKVSYVPLNVGIHKLSIMFDEQNILNSPFTCEISDPSACFVTSSDLASPTIGKEMNFQVDTRQGGPGMVQVTFNGKQQPCLFQLVSCNDGIYTYQFVAAEPGNYSIDITWAGEPIRGSPFKFLVPEPLRFYPEACQVTGVPPGRIRLGESVVLKVNTSEAGSGELKAMLVSPNNESACDISMDNDGMYIVSVIPGEVGKHHVVLQYGGEEIPQSPVMISVNNPKLIILDSSSLNHSLPVNKAIALPINTKNCGEGVLSVKFKTPNLDVDNAEVQTNHSNKHVALYVPTMVGNYTIEIYYDNNLCLPVPIEISVIDPQSVSDIVLTKTIPVLGNNYMLNKTIEFHVHAPDRDSSLLKMTAIGIKTGTSEPQPYINIVSNGNDNYTLQFRSTRSDDFKITITYNGVNLTGSPFTLPIRAPPRASKVAMFDPVIPLKSNEPIELIFDTSQAGQGALSAFAVNSKERTMPVYVEQVDDVMYRVAFIPRISDTFMVSVLFADKHINGSPFRVLYKEQKKEPPVCIHFEPEFKVKGLMGAAVYGRNSGRQEATVVQFKRGQYQISFNPSEPDIFDLRVYWFDEEIEGSPFEIDLQGMENESSESLVDSVPFALEDKIGMIAATAAGRNSGPIPVKLTTEGSDCSVYFTLQGSDSVDVNLFWNGKPFKGMPVHLAL